MSTSRIKRPEPCSHEACGSRRFHVGDDGYTYCDRGHQQSEQGTVIAEDTGELVVTGRKARKKDSDAESNVSRVSTTFSGTRGFEHYLLCLQLVLRKQLKWLVESRKLPAELETLVRDLWAVRLQKLRKRVSYDSDTDTEGQSQMFSSQSEGESTATEATRRSRRKSQISIAGTPNMLEIVALSYIGLLLLREPVTVADMYSWINAGDLLYYRVPKEVPLAMRGRLPATYQDLLEPQQLREPQKLHQTILDQLSVFHTDFGMEIPQINSPLVLYRWMRELALPVEIFAATQRLAQILEMDSGFALLPKQYATIVLQYPEARLMAIAVVATKLLFSMDDIGRHPTAATDLSALRMDWDAWSQQQASGKGNGEEHEPLSFGEALEYSEKDVLKASDEKLDQYLDWYETNMASEDVRERGRAGRDVDFRRTLFRLFPLSGAPAKKEDSSSSLHYNEARTDRLRHAQGLLRIKKVVGSKQEKVDLTGSFYRRFRTIADLDGVAKILYGQAAKMSGLSLEGMVQAVFAVESKMHKLEERLRGGQEG